MTRIQRIQHHVSARSCRSNLISVFTRLSSWDQMASSAADSLLKHHPLQILSAPSRQASFLLHVLGTTSFILSYKWLFDWPNVISESWGWHYQFLTIIGLSLALITFVIAILADITLSPKLFHIKNLLSVCSAPLEVLISILYWGLRSIDKHLVIPPDMELPLTPDIGFHLAPALFLAIDLLFFSPPWAITAFPAMVLSSVFAGLYWLWINQCYSRNGL